MYRKIRIRAFVHLPKGAEPEPQHHEPQHNLSLVFRTLDVAENALKDNREEHYGGRTDDKHHDLVHGDSASFAG